MFTNEQIEQVKKDLAKNWGENLVRECEAVIPFNDTMENFFSNCHAVNGSFESAVLTGIKKIFPSVYEAIPDYIGEYGWTGITNILIICGVQFDMEEE